jgi:hypothetical protein
MDQGEHAGFIPKAADQFWADRAVGIQHFDRNFAW